MEFLPLSLLNTFVYCPRRFYYEFVEGETRVNAFLLEGERVHEKVHQPMGARQEEGRLVRRRVYLASERLRVAGYLDVVEEEESQVVPVEYKKGKAGRGGPWLNDCVQLCAAALCLEEQWGVSVPKGFLYYAAEKDRYEVAFSEELRQHTLEVIGQAWALVERCARYWGSQEAPEPESCPIPEPLHDARCNGCSMAVICLHEEVSYLQGKGPPPSQVLPGLGQERVLYVDEQGAYLAKRSGRLRAEKEGTLLREIPLSQVDAIVLCGNVEMSTPLQKFLLRQGIPVHFLTFGGRYEGSLLPPINRNGLLRLAQYRALSDLSRCLEIARSIVAAKLSNYRTLILRRAREQTNPRLEEAEGRLRQALEGVRRARSLSELLGWEGEGTKVYFGVFELFLRGETWHFPGRQRRPPRDPVNALLSFAYSLLAADLITAIHVVGLDPYLGFYHQPRYARPSLALDLMEEFRPLMVDSLVIGLLNKRVLQEEDFEVIRGAYFLKERGREAVYAAYEQRKSEQITHPVFKYRLPYRRAFELQVRILAKHLMGELPRYYPLMVR